MTVHEVTTLGWNSSNKRRSAARYFGVAFITEPLVTSVQYTLVPSTPSAKGPFCPDATVVGMPLSSAAFITLPVPNS